MQLILSMFTSVLADISIYEIASRLTHPISLAAFGLAIILGVLTLKRKVPVGAWIVIALLVIAPIAISAYAEIVKQRVTEESIYKVRVTVITPEGTPTDEAKVWGPGEAKKITGGWQFDIPKGSKPKDGKLVIYASLPNRFLVGQQPIVLGEDYNPHVTISLQQNHVKIRGNVIDERNRAVAGASVTVSGYASEVVVTDATGSFVLPAHAARDEQVLLHVEKKGYTAVEQWHPAGDFPATIMLRK